MMTNEAIPSGWQRHDPRRVARHLIDISVAVSVTRGGVTSRLRGRSTDICEGGLGVLVPSELQAGEQVTLDFSLPLCREPFKIKAVVRNRVNSRCGIEFVALSAAQREAIARCCETLPFLER